MILGTVILVPNRLPAFAAASSPATKGLRKNNLVELALRFAPDLAAND